MKYSHTRTRNIWFWVGVILLSISALFWLIAVAAVVAEVKDAGSMILAGASSVSLPSERALIVCGTAKEDTGGEYFIEGNLTQLTSHLTSFGAPSQKQKGLRSYGLPKFSQG